MGALPLIAFLLVAALLYARERDPREALLASAVLAAAWLVAGTELLSRFRALRFGPVLAWWIAAAAGAGALLYRERARVAAVKVSAPRLTRGQAALLALLCLIVLCAGCQAYFSPPNNCDSFCYHLPRQLFWLQQGSVEHFSTSVLRQVTQPPLSEFAGLHLMILSGGDGWHNGVQWTAWVLTMLAASLITQRLGGGVTAQLFAALVVASAPTAYLEASNTKNDILVALFVSGAVYWAWERRPALLGLSLGAAALTKGTGVLFGFPIGAWALWKARRKPLELALVVLPALALNAGHFERNIRAFGSPVPLAQLNAYTPYDDVRNGLKNARGFASNLARTLAMNAITPSRGFDDALTSGVVRLHQSLGLTANEPAATVIYGQFRRLEPRMQADEDVAGMPFHLLLLLTLPLAWPWASSAAKRREPALLCASAAVSLALICFLFKWSRYSSRFLVADAALVAPLLALVWTSPRLRAGLPAVVAGLALALAPSLQAAQRPLFGARSVLTADPEQTRCRSVPSLCEPALAVASALAARSPRVVGLDTGWSYSDYIFERYLLDRSARPPLFAYFNAAFQPRGGADLVPDVVVSTSEQPRLRRREDGAWYLRQASAGPYSLYVRSADAP